MVLSVLVDVLYHKQFRDSEAAERAKGNLDGFELAGRPMKINHVTNDRTEYIGGAMELLDSDNFALGVGMTQQGRANLMAKLAEGHNAGTMIWWHVCSHDRSLCLDLKVPAVPALAQVPVHVPSSCFMLTNMFEANTSNQTDWISDIRDDVLEECMEFGGIFHIHVDPKSQVYLVIFSFMFSFLLIGSCVCEDQ